MVYLKAGTNREFVGAICLVYVSHSVSYSMHTMREQYSLSSDFLERIQFTSRNLGEPLNGIISGHSDLFILTETGFHYYAR